MKTYSGVLVLLTLIEIVRGREYDCYSMVNVTYHDFATKTAYDFVYERPHHNEEHQPYGSRHPQHQEHFFEEEIPDCEPIQLWSFARHGTRYPESHDFDHFRNLEALKDEIVRANGPRQNRRLCIPDLISLQEWSFNISVAEANMLTKQGYNDMFLMAERYKIRFPTLFRHEISSAITPPYEFRHTDSERTRASAQAFANGLLGQHAGVFIPEPVFNDPVLKPYDNCPAWFRQVKNNPNTYQEYNMFLGGAEMRNLLRNVSRRLGLTAELPYRTILNMYDVCRYNKAWYVNEKSPWCAAFIEEELKILEYLEDLATYYEAGYGHHFNMRLGCTAIRDMLERFSKLEYENFERGFHPIGVFYFTHTRALLMTLARLGIAESGVPLTHSNYYNQRHREWRTSRIAPFAGNLAAVFFKCNSGESNRVAFYLNERRVDFPGCDRGVCPWPLIRSKFYDIFLHCDLHWCNGSPRIEIMFPLIFFTLFHLFFYVSAN